MYISESRDLTLNRVNSTQSVRIRNLEGEVSRLLAENLELKEEIIRIHEETATELGTKALKQVETLKERLEEKLKDLGGVLQEFGEISVRPGRHGRALQQLSRPRDLGALARQRPLRLRVAVDDPVAEGRLPVIDEERRSSQDLSR